MDPSPSPTVVLSLYRERAELRARFPGATFTSTLEACEGMTSGRIVVSRAFCQANKSDLRLLAIAYQRSPVSILEYARNDDGTENAEPIL